MRRRVLLVVAVMAVRGGTAPREENDETTTWWEEQERLSEERLEPSKSEFVRWLQNATAVQRAVKKENGDARYVIAMADDYGLGNRINLVTSSFLLALATGRALAVVWPRTDCKRKRKANCDPTSINDLFEARPGYEWSANKWVGATAAKCRRDVKKRPKSRWVMGDPNDRGAVLKLAADHNLDAWRDRDKHVCAYGYYFWGWGLSCNPFLRAAVPGMPDSPWAVLGAVQDYLLPPSKLVRDRVDTVLEKKTGARKCGLGVHLRKADSDKYRKADPKWITRLRTELESTSPQGGVFIASDSQSRHTASELAKIVDAHPNVYLISPPVGKVTRDSADGNINALAENFVLASCLTLLPRELGASTFHDVAVARAWWQQNWSLADGRVFADAPGDKKNKHRRPVVAPVACSDLSKKNTIK